MNSKLTLSVNQMVIEEAKKYAKSTGKSLSSLVEEYLKSLVEPEPENSEEAAIQLVDELQGAVKLPDDFNYDKYLGDALLEKYLRE
ncbi:MAG: DUF6364 family protein [Bacteroidota bacterium]